MRALAVALILLGALALADATVTLVWQEPISALYATLRQDRLSGALQRAERAAPTQLERRTLASLDEERARIAFLAAELQRHARVGDAVGRIQIPRIGASYVVVAGTGTEALESGPGIYPETRFPGIAGTTAIAGHRTTFLAPFRHIDALSRGSVILLKMPYARFTYTVIGQRVVSPRDVQAAVANVGYSRLVLASTPACSAARYHRCSNPSIRTSSPRSSDSVTPGAPARTSPIQLTRTSPSSRTASSTRARLPGAAQKHSS